MTAETANGEYKPRPLTIIICTPYHRTLEPTMAASVANAMVHLMSIAQNYGAEVKVCWQLMKGSNLAQQRQHLSSRALEMRATHLLWWDSDIEAPADCIPRMLNHSQAVVCTNYPTKEMVSR